MRVLQNLGDLFPQNKDGGKIAAIDLGGNGSREFSYTDIDSLARGVARGIVARGHKRGTRIGILSANRVEYLAAMFGIMRAGMVAVPVNFKFSAETIHFILEDAGAELVFCDAARRPDCPPHLPTVQFGDDRTDEFEGFVSPGPFDAVIPEPDEPAMFLYTSGTTGTPKGVVLSHQSHLWVVKTRLDGNDFSPHRFLIAAPLYHMNALALSQLAFAAHATIVLLPQFTSAAYLDAIERYRCTWLTAVPPMIAMILRDPNFSTTDISSVKSLRMGSAPVSESLMRAIELAFPQAAVVNAYGTTEGGPVVFGPHPEGMPQPALSVGCPHPKVELRLAESENANEGILELKCPAVMNGYHNRPHLKPPITADGFYITGDVFRRDENGFHFFVGRSDDMFVCGGENIYPGDVERMLERHLQIAQTCVLPIDDEIKGQKPVAFIVTKDGAILSQDEVKLYALAHAPAYQHPRHVWFLDKLPLSSTNKVDRTALMKLAKEWSGI